MCIKVKYKVFLVLFILPVVFGVFWIGRYAFKQFDKAASEMSYDSAMLWLEASVSESLNNYYRLNGNYPADLNELAIPFPGDNADPEMLRNFRYSTDGKDCEVICEIKHSNGSLRTYRKLAREGRIIRSEMYVDKELLHSWDAND